MKEEDWLWPETVTLPSLVASKWEDTSQEEDEQAGEIQWEQLRGRTVMGGESGWRSSELPGQVQVQVLELGCQGSIRGFT